MMKQLSVISYQLSVKRLLFVALLFCLIAFTPGAVRLTPNHHPVNKEGLIGWWAYRNTGSVSTSGTWKDYSGYGNDGTLDSSTSVDNQGVHLDGSVNRTGVDCGNNTNFDMTGEFTISFIMNADTDLQSYETFITKRGSSTNYEFGLSATSRYLYFYNGSTIYTSSWNPTIGVFYHVVIVKTSSNIIFYIDGSEVYNVSAVLGATNTDPLLIGHVAGFNQDFNGIMADVMFFNRALSAGEIKANYLKNKRN